MSALLSNKKQTAVPAKVLLWTMMITMLIFCASSAHAQGFIDVGSENRLNAEITIPITINNYDKLNSGQLTITAPAKGAPIYYQGIEFADNFNGSSRSSFTSSASLLSDDKITISFVSNSSENYKINSELLCYISYRFTPGIARGTALKIQIENAQLRDQNGSLLPTTIYPGRVVNNYRLGDVLGNDTITPASAALVLRHVNNIEPITDHGALEAMDLNANGGLDMQDAMLLLNHIVGLQDNFFTIKSIVPPLATKGAEYSTIIEGAHGSPPYTWERGKGQLPGGLSLNAQTGEISGKPSKTGDYTFTILAKDIYGHSAEKELKITVDEPGIAAITGITEVSNTGFKIGFDRQVYSIERKEIVITPSLSITSITLSEDHLFATVVTARQKAGTQYEVDFQGSRSSFIGTDSDFVTVNEIGDKTMVAGSTLTIPVGTNPDDAVLSVSGGGSIASAAIQKQDLVITAKKAGTVQITVTANKGGYIAGKTVFKLTVEKPGGKGHLTETIASAQRLHDEAVEGEETGQYASGAKAALQAAIDIAKGMLEQQYATQEEIDQGTARLEEALDVFKAALSSHILEIKINYMAFMNIHTIEVLASGKTNHITINDTLLMHYEGGDRFSLATTTINPGDTFKINLYDRFSNIIESRYLLAIPTG